MMNRFIDERKDNWQRLEDLLGILRGASLRGLDLAEIREFGELYRRAAADLAIARAESRDPKLISYLNSLVIRAHGKIYRSRGSAVSIVRKFFTAELPQTFRANIGYMLVACGIFVVSSVFGFVVTWLNTDFTNFVGLAGVTEQIAANDQWWMSLNGSNQVGSSFILSNNIIVSIRVFAMGALLGVGAVYEIAYFGAYFGSVFGACFRLNPPFGSALASFVVGHGVIELSVVVFCAGAGMMIGYAMVNPGDLTRIAAVKKKGLEAARIVIGGACFLVVAGIIEGFLSPAPVPAAVKYATGITTGILLYTYLFLVGRKNLPVGL